MNIYTSQEIQNIRQRFSIYADAGKAVNDSGAGGNSKWGRIALGDDGKPKVHFAMGVRGKLWHLLKVTMLRPYVYYQNYKVLKELESSVRECIDLDKRNGANTNLREISQAVNDARGASRSRKPYMGSYRSFADYVVEFSEQGRRTFQEMQVESQPVTGGPETSLHLSPASPQEGRNTNGHNTPSQSGRFLMQPPAREGGQIDDSSRESGKETHSNWDGRSRHRQRHVSSVTGTDGETTEGSLSSTVFRGLLESGRRISGDGRSHEVLLAKKNQFLAGTPEREGGGTETAPGTGRSSLDFVSPDQQRNVPPVRSTSSGDRTPECRNDSSHRKRLPEPDGPPMRVRSSSSLRRKTPSMLEVPGEVGFGSPQKRRGLSHTRTHSLFFDNDGLRSPTPASMPRGLSTPSIHRSVLDALNSPYQASEIPDTDALWTTKNFLESARDSHGNSEGRLRVKLRNYMQIGKWRWAGTNRGKTLTGLSKRLGLEVSTVVPRCAELLDKGALDHRSYLDFIAFLDPRDRGTALEKSEKPSNSQLVGVTVDDTELLCSQESFFLAAWEAMLESEIAEHRSSQEEPVSATSTSVTDSSPRRKKLAVKKSKAAETSKEVLREHFRVAYGHHMQNIQTDLSDFRYPPTEQGGTTPLQ